MFSKALYKCFYNVFFTRSDFTISVILESSKASIINSIQQSSKCYENRIQIRLKVCPKSSSKKKAQGNLMYLQKGRFATAIRAKKHPQLPRRNRKRAVPKNWHQFALLCSDWIVQIATFNCNTTLSSINPAHTPKNKRFTTRPKETKKE